VVAKAEPAVAISNPNALMIFFMERYPSLIYLLITARTSG